MIPHKEREFMGNNENVNPVQVQKYLKGVDYPCSKQDIVDKAKEEGADENVVSMLERMPDREFETPADVSAALGEARE